MSAYEGPDTAQHRCGDAETSVMTPGDGCMLICQSEKITLQQRCLASGHSCVLRCRGSPDMEVHINNTTVPVEMIYFTQKYKELRIYNR